MLARNYQYSPEGLNSRGHSQADAVSIAEEEDYGFYTVGAQSCTEQRVCADLEIEHSQVLYFWCCDTEGLCQRVLLPLVSTQHHTISDLRKGSVPHRTDQSIA